MKDRDNLELGLPIGDIVRNEPKVKESSRQIAFERQRCDAGYILDFFQLDRNIDMERLFLRGHGKVPFVKREVDSLDASDQRVTL